jgi:hypothetical protein
VIDIISSLFLEKWKRKVKNLEEAQSEDFQAVAHALTHVIDYWFNPRVKNWQTGEFMVLFTYHTM